MAITDSKLGDAVRPVFLTFAGEVAPGEPFAHMIENPDLLAALAEKAQQHGVTLIAEPVADFSADPKGVTARLASGALGLDMYNMREALKKAGLVYLDEPESD